MGDERARATSHSEELAWAAGFWDGEGSCGCYSKNDRQTRKSNRRASDTYLRASVNQTDREPLDRFLAAVGVGKLYGPYTPKKNLLSQTPYWGVQISGRAVDDLFQILWPYLCGPKKQQYLDARAKFDARPEPSKGGHVCAPDCTCGRQKWKTAELDEKTARRREQQREATRRYRAKKKEKKMLIGISVGDLVQVGSNDPVEDGKLYEVTHKGETHISLRCMETSAEITVPIDQPWVKVVMA